MKTPRSYTKVYTAMSKTSLGQTSVYLLSWESPTSSPCLAIWPTVPTGITTREGGKSLSSSRPSSSKAAKPVSAQSYVMNLPTPSSSILEKMRYGAWLDGMAIRCLQGQKDAPTESQKSFGENPSTMTIFSSKPSIEGPDQDPAIWGYEETP